MIFLCAACAAEPEDRPSPPKPTAAPVGLGAPIARTIGADVAIAEPAVMKKESASDLNSKASSPSETDAESPRSLLSAEQAKTNTVGAAARNRMNIRMFVTSADSGISPVINGATGPKRVPPGS